MNKYVRIEGEHIDLEGLKKADHSAASLRKTGHFEHLDDAKKEAAFQALEKELSEYEAKPAVVTVEKGNTVKNFVPEETKTSKTKEK